MKILHGGYAVSNSKTVEKILIHLLKKKAAQSIYSVNKMIHEVSIITTHDY
jgi:hypothetical protein